MQIPKTIQEEIAKNKGFPGQKRCANWTKVLLSRPIFQQPYLLSEQMVKLAGPVPSKQHSTVTEIRLTTQIEHDSINGN